MSERDENLKAIQTSYNGYLFRSRLEARWAVFLDELGIRYEYETEGFELAKGVRYLPDFYIPKPGYWLEVKPELPQEGDEAWQKALLLADQSGEAVYVVVGAPTVHPYETEVLRFPSSSITHDDLPTTLRPETCAWMECPVCDIVQPFCIDWQSPCGCLYWLPNHGSWRIEVAMHKARSACFEFGDRARGPREDRP